MLKEYQLVESRLDYDCQYQEATDGFTCLRCRKPRALHALQGFIPNQSPSKLGIDQKANYRGPHFAWSRPGSFSTLERREIEAEQKIERERIERAIRKDQEQFRRKTAQ